METKWSKSESIAKLVEALAKAQLKFDPVLKDSDNPAYRSKYADLQSVISATQTHLASEGLTVIQMPQASFGVDEAKMLTVTTLLAHCSGEWIASDLTLPAMMRERFDAQSVGSAVTYARRYALQAVLGVAAELDDDGNKASGVGTKEAAQEVAKKKIAESKVKEKQSESQVTSEHKVIIGRPQELNGHHIRVSGFVDPLAAFFADTSSQRFQSRNDGSVYWRVPQEYEKDLVKICNNLNLEVEG